jgi:hypothetical protein
MSIDPEELDSLVDGELPEDRRQRLLSRCEQIPGGWRACALAFLEAQCWRRELRSLAEAAREAPAAAPDKLDKPDETLRLAATPPARPSAWRRHGTTMLAMAASFLATMFAVGMIRMEWQDGGPLTTQIADNAPLVTDDGPATARPLAPRRGPETSRGESAVADASPGDGLGAGAAVRWVRVSMPGDDPQSDRELLLPAIEASHFNDGLLSSAAPAGIDPQLEALLRQNGLEMRSHRQLVPIHTDEGQDAVFPMNRYEIRPSSGNVVQ